MSSVAYHALGDDPSICLWNVSQRIWQKSSLSTLGIDRGNESVLGAHWPKADEHLVQFGCKYLDAQVGRFPDKHICIKGLHTRISVAT